MRNSRRRFIIARGARLIRNHTHGYNRAAYRIIIYFLHRINILRRVLLLAVAYIALQTHCDVKRCSSKCPTERVINTSAIASETPDLSEFNASLRKKLLAHRKNNVSRYSNLEFDLEFWESRNPAVGRFSSSAERERERGERRDIKDIYILYLCIVFIYTHICIQDVPFQMIQTVQIGLVLNFRRRTFQTNVV